MSHISHIDLRLRNGDTVPVSVVTDDDGSVVALGKHLKLNIDRLEAYAMVISPPNPTHKWLYRGWCITWQEGETKGNFYKNHERYWFSISGALTPENALSYAIRSVTLHLLNVDAMIEKERLTCGATPTKL